MEKSNCNVIGLDVKSFTEKKGEEGGTEREGEKGSERDEWEFVIIRQQINCLFRESR